jgi:hypothetical protein
MGVPQSPHAGPMGVPQSSRTSRTSQSKQSDADLFWVERVDGGGYGEPRCTGMEN